MEQGFQDLDEDADPEERVYCSPALRPKTFYGRLGFLEQLRAIFGMHRTLTLGRSAVPVLRAAHIAGGDPVWLSLAVEIEEVGPVILTIDADAGFVWQEPQDLD